MNRPVLIDPLRRGGDETDGTARGGAEGAFGGVLRRLMRRWGGGIDPPGLESWNAHFLLPSHRRSRSFKMTLEAFFFPYGKISLHVSATRPLSGLLGSESTVIREPPDFYFQPAKESKRKTSLHKIRGAALCPSSANHLAS